MKLFKQPLFYTSLLALFALGLVIGNYAFGVDWYTPTSIPPLGNVNLTSSYESTIATGTASQYWRGDKTWQTLPPDTDTWITTQTCSTDYALQSIGKESKTCINKVDYSDIAYDLSCTDCIGTTEIADSYVLNTGDAMTGALAMGANKITGLGTPTVGTDAATMSYADSAVAAKANIASPTFTGVVAMPTPFTLGAVSVLPTGTELNYLDGVTSAIQTQFTAKAPLASPTFTGTVVLPATTSIGTVSYTELGYLNGVTSAIQTQFTAKAPLASPTFTGTVTAPTFSGALSGNATTATNADKLDEYHGASASTVNTYALRDASGDINARLFRSEYDTTNATIGYIMTQIDAVSNNYIRPSTPAQLKTGLALNLVDNTADTAKPVSTAQQTALDLKAPLASPTFTGSVTAPAFYYSSDESLKKNIQKIETPLAKIIKLNGVSFDWKESGNKSIGLIAQDVEKVFPEIVNTDKETGLKSIEYAKLVAPLIEAIKEQQKMIDEQKVLINQQGEEIKKLKVSFGQL